MEYMGVTGAPPNDSSRRNAESNSLNESNSVPVQAAVLSW